MDRIDDLARQQGEQGEAIAVLQTQMKGVIAALEANTRATQEHTKLLAEYNGARKLVHWLATAGAALGAYFFGKSGAAP